MGPRVRQTQLGLHNDFYLVARPLYTAAVNKKLTQNTILIFSMPEGKMQMVHWGISL
jgi:hypothetical protein